jgi:hypothetical protein
MKGEFWGTPSPGRELRPSSSMHLMRSAEPELFEAAQGGCKAGFFVIEVCEEML